MIRGKARFISFIHAKTRSGRFALGLTFLTVFEQYLREIEEEDVTNALLSIVIVWGSKQGTAHGACGSVNRTGFAGEVKEPEGACLTTLVRKLFYKQSFRRLLSVFIFL